MIRATVNAVALASALRDGVAQSSGPLAILQHALIETVADGLRVTTTDGETLIRTTLAADVQSQGAVCVQAHLMRAATMAGSELSLEEVDGFVAVKRGPRSRVKVPTLPAEDWPAPDTFEWLPCPVAWEDIAQAIDSCRYAASLKDIRPFCSAVCIGGGFIGCVDGHRMAITRNEYSGAAMLIPIKPAAILRKYLSSGCDLQIGQARGETLRIGVTSGTDRFELKLFAPQGLPNIVAQIPTSDPKARAKFDTLALRGAVSRLLPFTFPLALSKAARFPVARITHAEGAMRFEDRTGENADEAPMTDATGEFSGAINLEQLSDALTAIDRDEVCVSQYGEGKHSRFVLTAVEHAATHLIVGADV